MSVRLTIGHLCGPVNSVFEHIELLSLYGCNCVNFSSHIVTEFYFSKFMAILKLVKEILEVENKLIVYEFLFFR